MVKLRCCKNVIKLLYDFDKPSQARYGNPTNFLLAFVCNNCNRRAHIRHQCIKTTVLSCHRCLINTGIDKLNNIKI